MLMVSSSVQLYISRLCEGLYYVNILIMVLTVFRRYRVKILFERYSYNSLMYFQYITGRPGTLSYFVLYIIVFR